VGEVTTTTFPSISGIALPSMHHNNSPLLQCPIFETSATALCGTTGNDIAPSIISAPFSPVLWVKFGLDQYSNISMPKPEMLAHEMGWFRQLVILHSEVAK